MIFHFREVQQSKNGPGRGHLSPNNQSPNNQTPSHQILNTNHLAKVAPAGATHPLGRTQGPPQTPKITPRAPQAPSQTLRENLLYFRSLLAPPKGAQNLTGDMFMSPVTNQKIKFTVFPLGHYLKQDDFPF